MPAFDIREWVDQNPGQKAFREAVHTILTAISGSPELRTGMTMKGGILLALAYRSSRYTKDIDFSSEIALPEFNRDDFVQKLSNALVSAVESLDYGLDCAIQGVKQKPPREDATFPTIQIKVGYADKSNRRAHKRLLSGQSPQIVQIDYSLNEPTRETEFFTIEEGSDIRTYALEELIGEKLRALLQQEIRKRFRRQDIYDLHFLLDHRPECHSQAMQPRILASLREKAGIRHLTVSRESMANPEIRWRSAGEYRQLAAEVEDELPDFDAIYGQVQHFYENLPWKTSDGC